MDPTFSLALNQGPSSVVLSDKTQFFIETVSDQLSDTQLTDFVGNVAITKEENHLNEFTIHDLLCGLQKNPPERLEDVLCKINESCVPYFYKGKFRTVAEKLEAIAIPILENQLKEKIPQWNTDSYFELDGHVRTVEIVKELHEKRFPCHGIASLLYRQNMLNFSLIELYSNQQETMDRILPIYEALHHVDPLSCISQLGLAICSMSRTTQYPKYIEVKNLLENVVENGLDKHKDLACKHLSDLLKKGSDGCSPDRLKAKDVILKLLNGNQIVGRFPKSTMALMDILIEEQDFSNASALGRQLQSSLSISATQPQYLLLPSQENSLPETRGMGGRSITQKSSQGKPYSRK